MMARTLILGASGMVGRSWHQRLEAKGWQVIAPSKAVLDLRRPAALERFLSEHAPFDLVVNAAAYTAVDQAEDEPKDARALNAVLPTLLVECLPSKTPWIHYSTDYVFDGTERRPYLEEDLPCPVSVYGATKFEGERAAVAGGALVIRTSWVFAPWGKNFVATMTRLLQRESELRVVNDQRGRPTFAPDLAEMSLVLFEGGHRGLYHLTNAEKCTWFELARAVAAELTRRGAQPRSSLVPITTLEYPTRAVRPEYSVLSTQKAEAVLGHPMPSLKRGLAAAVAAFAEL